MIEAHYEDPKHPAVLPKKPIGTPKVAVVVTFFAAIRHYGHYTEDKLESLKLNLLAHKHFKAGVDYDLIIVNHGAPLDFYPDAIVLDRPNEGFSFGGWKQAWEEFGDKYDFYLFCEDDNAPTQDGWLLRFLMKFMEYKEIGAVGNFVEARSSTEGRFSTDLWAEIGYTRDMMYNFDGGYTFTSSQILKQVDEYGGLIVLPCEPAHERAATVNECLFQQPILELGYSIVAFEGFVIHGSELYTGNVAELEGDPAPLMNVNARRKIPRAAEIFAPVIASYIEHAE